MPRTKLERRLLRLLRSHREPCSLPQLVHHLLAERWGESTVLVLSRGTIRRKRRLERRVTAALALVAVTVERGGEVLYVAADPLPPPSRPSWTSRLHAWIKS